MIAAEAQSRAESARIESEAAVEAAKLKVEASRIESDAELERLLKAREAEIELFSNIFVVGGSLGVLATRMAPSSSLFCSRASRGCSREQ